MVDRVAILADDSANWKIAGLRQLERLALEISELAAAGVKTIRISILWSADVPPGERLQPQHPRLSAVEFETSPPPSADLVLSSRIFLYRHSSSRLASKVKPGRRLPHDFSQLLVEVENEWQESNPAEGWEYLDDAAQIPGCEKRFLRASGKSQDGVVSRFVNRPISRAITRVLLQTPITPSAWTLSIFVLALAGATLLSRGDYSSVILGLLFYQLYSILDGCDGEIARAKYLESSAGRQLDTWCDVFGNLLLVLGLGYGFSRTTEGGSFYLFEGIFVTILIVANELLLFHLSEKSLIVENEGALYPRHKRMLEDSGLLVLGGRFASWIIQFTKRDVAFLAFLFLALVHQAPWVLHLSGAVAAVSVLLALKSHFR